MSESYTSSPEFVAEGAGPAAGREHGAVESDRRLLAAIVKASRDAIWSWNTAAVITSWNAEAERLFGYAPAEIIGRSIVVLVPPERLRLAQDAVARLLRGEYYGQYETVRLHKDGTPIDVELTVSPITDNSGSIVGVATLCRDVRQRRLFEDTLARRVNELTALYALTADLQGTRSVADVGEAALGAIIRALLCQRSALFLRDDSGVMRFVASRGFSEVDRRAFESVCRRTLGDGNPQPICIAELAAVEKPEAHEVALRTQGVRALALVPLVAEARLIGEFVAYYDQPHVFTAEETSIAMTVARQVAIGITQKHQEEARRRAEANLRGNEARLRLAIEAAQLGIWDWNLVTGEMVYSGRAKEIYGFPADAPVTFAQVRDAVHPEDLPLTAELSRRARDPAIREKAPYEFRIIRPDGALRWIAAYGDTVFAPVDGVEQAVRYAGTIQDITARKETAHALFQSETRLRLAFEAGQMGVWEYDATREMLVGSPELNRVLGFPPDARPHIDELRAGYLPGEQQHIRDAGREAMAAGNSSFEVEFRYRWPDVSVHWLMLRAEFVYRDGKLSRLIGIVTDITYLKHAQEQQAFLINELNHRVKNTLATVQSLAVMTLKTKPPAEFTDAFVQRLAALSATHDLLTRSGWEHASLDDVIGAELKPYMNGQIKLSPWPAPILLTPRAALSLGLVFHELATNAAKHGALSQSGGRLIVTWQRTDDNGRPHLAVAWREANGPAPKTARMAGFGSRLIESSITDDLGGRISLNYPPSGFHAEIAVPVEMLCA